jgi:hypothetical protein
MPSANLSPPCCRFSTKTPARPPPCTKSESRPKMATHKFKLRQTVFLQPTIFNRDAPRGAFEVTKQLPERDGQFEYQIKSSSEPHERVARESELGSK